MEGREGGGGGVLSVKLRISPWSISLFSLARIAIELHHDPACFLVRVVFSVLMVVVFLIVLWLTLLSKIVPLAWPRREL